MKILRIHKGFTTNSSSTNDWIPSTPGNTAANQTPQTNGTAQSNGNSQTGGTGQTSNTSQQAKALTQQPSRQEQAGQPASSHFFSNSLILGAIVGGLALIFFLEKLIKKIFSRDKKQADDH